MSKRKIVLLSACAVLLCIYIIQLVFALRSPVKNITIADDVDTVLIKNGSNTVSLAKTGSGWIVGDKKYAANESMIDGIVNAVKSINVLNTVGKTGNEAVEERYELNDEKVITVTASKSGRILRTLKIGKASSTGSQTYITIDNGKDVCLVSGNLHETFGKTADDIRSKIIYKADKDKLSNIAETVNGITLTVAKTGSPAVWGAADGTPAVDSEKAGNWAESLYSVSADSWLDDSFVLPEKPESVTVITAGTQKITLTIYKTGKDKDVKYYGTCSETPYKFELSSYAAGKYMKKAEDFKK
ncbi:MAG: DUF4340 domain-containing protein [Treponema sp.]